MIEMNFTEQFFHEKKPLKERCLHFRKDLKWNMTTGNNLTGSKQNKSDPSSNSNVERAVIRLHWEAFSLIDTSTTFLTNSFPPHVLRERVWIWNVFSIYIFSTSILIPSKPQETFPESESGWWHNSILETQNIHCMLWCLFIFHWSIGKTWASSAGVILVCL